MQMAVIAQPDVAPFGHVHQLLLGVFQHAAERLDGLVPLLSRQMCLDPLQVGQDGTIGPIELDRLGQLEAGKVRKRAELGRSPAPATAQQHDHGGKHRSQPRCSPRAVHRCQCSPEISLCLWGKFGLKAREKTLFRLPGNAEMPPNGTRPRRAGVFLHLSIREDAIWGKPVAEDFFAPPERPRVLFRET